MAQKRFVIEIYRSDYSERGFYHVGCIKPSTEAHFDHRRFDAQFSKKHKPHSGNCFEIRWMELDCAAFDQPLRRFMNDMERLCELFVRNILAIHANPLCGL